MTNLTSGDVSNVQCSGNICSFENKEFNAQQSAKNKLKVNLTLEFSTLPNVEKVTIDGAELCSASGSPTPSPVITTTKGPLPQVTTAISGDIFFHFFSIPLIVIESKQSIYLVI